jgi:hypothetical protein
VPEKLLALVGLLVNDFGANIESPFNNQSDVIFFDEN